MRAIRTVRAFPTDGRIATLGWSVVAWCEAWLVQPDGDAAGEPWRFTREQLNFVLWWYALDAEGKFAYRRAVLRRGKGWGKSPFLGALALAELCGPVRFGGWDDASEPIAVPEPAPWIVVAGVSETQAENTLSAIRAMAESGPLAEGYGLDVGITRINYPALGGKLHPVTASAATQEGARPTFAILDETHHWTKSNGGLALAKVIRRNLAKRPGGTARSIETTNAHEPGFDSVAESSYEAHLAITEGRTRDSGLLYDSREAPAVDLADEAALREALVCAYGDAVWLDLDRLLGEIYDPATSPEESRRFYLNQIVAAADSWVAPHEWDANYSEAVPPLLAGETVTLGFDGGRTDDSSALVALRVDDGAPFVLGLWEKPDGPAGAGWEVDKAAVRGFVDHAFATFDVVAFHSDVAEWETDVDLWRDAYAERLLVKATTRHAVAFDMRAHQADVTRAVEALNRGICDHEAPYGPHTLDDGRDAAAALRRHVLNARRRPNRFGVSFGKETRESPKKVDILAALILARMARSRVLADGVLTKRRKRSGRFASF